MAKIEAIQVWSAYEIRSMCVKNDYYTRGDNEAYRKMLNFVSEHKPTTENIYKVAVDIVAHSDLSEEGVDDIEMIEGMMFDISKDCVSTHYTINA